MEASFSAVNDFSSLNSADYDSSFLGDGMGKFNETSASASADYPELAGNAKKTLLGRNIVAGLAIDGESKYDEMKELRGKSKKDTKTFLKKQVAAKKGSAGAGAFPLI